MTPLFARRSVREVYAMACPNCGSDQALRIEAMTWVGLTPDGPEVEDYHDWNDESLCSCCNCQYRGEVINFCIIERKPNDGRGQ